MSPKKTVRISRNRTAWSSRLEKQNQASLSVKSLIIAHFVRRKRIKGGFPTPQKTSTAPAFRLSQAGCGHKETKNGTIMLIGLCWKRCGNKRSGNPFCISLYCKQGLLIKSTTHGQSFFDLTVDSPTLSYHRTSSSVSVPGQT